jgi:zinc transport system substrate-binding protein
MIAVAIGLVLVGVCAPSRADQLDVVVSIKPVHSLVAAVAEGVVEPRLLLQGSASPHAYVMSPSAAAALESADVVFWIGEGFERFLAQPLANLSGDATVVAVEDSDGLILLERREGGFWGHESHADHDDDQAPFDGHLWLDPRNAIAIVTKIADVLASRDPANAALFRANAERLVAGLVELDRDIEAQLAPVRKTPFIVFHDAIQYFEKRYGLAGAGAITISPEQPPGAKRLLELRDAIAARDAACVLREPHASSDVIYSIISGTPVNVGVLDPEGSTLGEGSRLYFTLMREMATSLRNCLESAD